jgi:uncharacterized protein YdiU (UPF0061 family)
VGQRLLPAGQVDQRPGAIDTLIQQRDHLLRREQPRLGGRELQGERQAVQATAYFGHREGVFAGQLESGMGITRPIHEQPHRRRRD